MVTGEERNGEEVEEEGIGKGGRRGGDPVSSCHFSLMQTHLRISSYKLYI